MEEKKVLLFTGDSITDGGRYKLKSQEWDLNHQMGHSYPYVVNGLLGSLYSEKQFVFKNRGVSGNRIIDLYARIHMDLLDLKPDILTILVGVNDGPIDINGNKPTEVTKYKTLYRMLLKEVKQELPDCKIVLMEPFVCNAGRLKEEYPIWRSCVNEFAKAVKELSEEFDTVFIPLQELFDRHCEQEIPEYWCWDGVHPTENGHGLIAVQWMKTMKAYLGIENIII